MRRVLKFQIEVEMREKYSLVVTDIFRNKEI